MSRVVAHIEDVGCEIAPWRFPSGGLLDMEAETVTSVNSNSYDSLTRLTTLAQGTLSSDKTSITTANTLPESSQSFDLDAVGNQTAVTTDGTTTVRTANSQNELKKLTTGDVTTGLSYDNDGNTTTNENGDTLVYDAWNHLVGVSGANVQSYAYDAQGRQISELESGIPTSLYYSSQGQVLEERQGGIVTGQNVFSIDYVNDLLLRDDNSVSGSLGKENSGLGNRVYYQHDANFNETATISNGGNVINRYVYTPYGVQTVLTAGWTMSTAGNSVDGFQGGRYDPATGLYLFNSGGQGRPYDPSTGTWGQQDRAGYADGADLYGFARGNPAALTDPAGLAAAPAFRTPPGDPRIVHFAAVADTEQLFWEWIFGGGIRNGVYGPNHVLTKELARGDGAQQARDAATAALKANAAMRCPSAGPLTGPPVFYSPGLLRYLADYCFNVPTGGLFSNPVTTFVGGFRITWVATNIDQDTRTATVHFNAFNASTLHSATRIPKTDIGLPNNPLGPNGPLGTTTQTFDWDETLSW